MRDILVTGLPGAGKGTLAKKLADFDVDIVCISTGDIAREISEDSAATGAFAPEEWLRSELRKRVEKAHEAGRPVVVDGFPRKAEQVVWAEKHMNRPLYVHLDTSPMVCIRRLLVRGRMDDTVASIARRMDQHGQSIEEVMGLVKQGERDEDWIMISNNELHDAKVVAITAEWGIK